MKPIKQYMTLRIYAGGAYVADPSAPSGWKPAVDRQLVSTTLAPGDGCSLALLTGSKPAIQIAKNSSNAPTVITTHPMSDGLAPNKLTCKKDKKTKQLEVTVRRVGTDRDKADPKNPKKNKPAQYVYQATVDMSP